MIAKLAVNLSSPFLEMLACADVRWVKVSEIEEVHDQEEWVFDFTVPGYHNFVANNFIVHNTTTLAKLARMLKEFEPVIAAADTFRAASIEQLEEHSRRLGFEIVKHKYGADSAAVIFDAKKHAAASGSKLVLADTAGRSHANVNLMDELKKVCRVNKPDMKILVLDALTGNDIYDQAKLFNDAVGVDAIILTKTDVYEKGGAALSAAYTIKKPILYLGTGQNYEDLKEFSPEAIANMLLE
jgi:fused signal recognition particle receptor